MQLVVLGVIINVYSDYDNDDYYILRGGKAFAELRNIYFIWYPIL